MGSSTRHDEWVLPFSLPHRFVTDRVLLTRCECIWGVSHGWIALSEVDPLLKASAGSERDSSRRHFDAASQRDIDLMLKECEKAEKTSSLSRVWMFLALSWALEHMEDFKEPLGVVDQIYAEFDYPEEITPLIGWIPVRQSPPGWASGSPEALFENWRRYLAEVGDEYANRGPGSTPGAARAP